MTDYTTRLKIAIGGDLVTIFKTESGLSIAKGYNRIVLGGHGPYVEYDSDQIDLSRCAIPENQQWRLTNKNAYYVEYRTTDACHVKIYYQLKPVDYADYLIGLYYISPFALRLEDGTAVINPLRPHDKT